jgi:ribosomal protein L40E
VQKSGPRSSLELVGGCPRLVSCVSMGDQQQLVCVECGAESTEDARGWRSCLGSGSEDLDARDVEAFVFCPDCAKREFGRD